MNAKFDYGFLLTNGSKQFCKFPITKHNHAFHKACQKCQKANCDLVIFYRNILHLSYRR